MVALLSFAFLVLSTSLLLQQGNAEAPAAIAPRVTRAAMSDQIQKWENGIIYYTFDSSVSIHFRNILRDAMDEWEDNTCVIFKAQKDETPNFVEFYSRPNEEYCTCDSKGDRGGKQLIKLGYTCQEKGEVLHLLGHILGFSHEQTRPDRDTFVQINFDNIEKGQEGNFDKIPHNSSIGTVDESIGYDYNSIMHLKPTAFSKNGLITTEVMNEIEYDYQGRPKLGQRLKTSEKDIQHTNSLYGCPNDNNNVRGILQVNIMNGESLPETTNPTVQLTVMKSNGDNKIVSTQCKSCDVRNPTWNVHFRIPIDGSTSFPWQNIRLKFFGSENDIPVPISMSETIRVVPGQHTSLKHCIDQECSGYLMYNYEFLSDGDECDPNPCIHGNCIDGLVDYACSCPPGFDGKNCSNGGPCEPNPCNITGTQQCVDNGPLDYTCQCKVGYTGKECSIDVCSTHPCENNGTCIHHDNSRGYQCTCTSGYQGGNCQTHVCSTQPCQNGGTCSHHSTHGYQCSCRPGYQGVNCQTHVCSTQPCQNGGTCSHHSTRGYQCSCRPGYQGVNCQTHVCSTQPCRNGGTCTHSANSHGYICNCRPGYQGTTCSINVCSSQPCQNGGTCVHYGNSQGYQCYCQTGYQGENCTSHVCSTQPCRNGGTCSHHSTRAYQCSCRPGYQGENCNIDVCSSNPCRNRGTCRHYANSHGYICNCRPGYQGATCSINVCSSRPCQNGGTCVHYGNSRGYQCYCQTGYQGDTCNINVCSRNPCRNGGTCVHYANSRGYICNCRQGYQGTTCSTNVCSSRPCRNSGTCVHYSNSRGYVCECGSQYSGANCQTDLCPCQNGGTCSSYTSSTSYTCSCRSGYGGERCQYRRGDLRIYANRGYNLPDTDGWFAGDSDPYFRAVAYDQDGNSRSQSTHHDQGDESPEWFKWLNFGVDEWQRFSVRLYDDDVGSDDTLSSWHTYYPQPGCHRNIRVCGHNGCGGYVYFDYCFD